MNNELEEIFVYIKYNLKSSFKFYRNIAEALKDKPFPSKENNPKRLESF